MITLNLLPPKEKEIFVGQKKLRRILSFGTASLFFIFVFLVLLGSVWLYLFVQFNSFEAISQAAYASPQSQAFLQFKKEVDEANSELKYYNQIQQGTKNYSAALEEMARLASDGIKFSSISIDTNKVVTSGEAATRDNLVSFKDRLAASSYFVNLNAPLSNFLKQANINFSFSFGIK